LKIRNGFVSNSSSSSFVILFKGDLKRALLRAFAFPSDHIFGGISCQNELAENITEIYWQAATGLDGKIFNDFEEYIEYILKNQVYENRDDFLSIKKYGDLKNLSEDFKVAIGDLWTDAGELEEFLAGLYFNYISPTLIFRQDP
jgi:hypothetical protein